MLGALAMSATPRRRRRFDSGGSTDTTDPRLLGSDGQPILPPIPPGGALPAADAMLPPGEAGALTAAGPSPPPPTKGALPPAASAAAAKTQTQKAAIDRATANIAARNTLLASGAANPNNPTITNLDQATGMPPQQGALAPPVQAQQQAQQPPSRFANLPIPVDPGWNVPYMAMAGAMLAPTRSGGFAESLGNALTAGAAETQKQREMVENEALRQQQQEFNNSWRQGQLANTANRNNTYAEVSAARAQELQTQAAMLTAKAAMAGASHVTEADLIAKTADQLVKSGAVNPATGEPYNALTALQAARSTQAQLENAGTNANRQQSIAAWRADLASRATTKAEQDRIKEMTDEQIRLMVAGQNNGTAITPDAVKATVQQLRANAGAPPASAAGAPASPAAPANPTFPPAPAAAIDILRRDPSSLPYFVKRWGSDQARAALGQ